uniref:Protein dopey-1 n=1 Tax=Haemonchus placei TaxID=6290 RepID=A0A0N4WVT8_HAEPC
LTAYRREIMPAKSQRSSKSKIQTDNSTQSQSASVDSVDLGTQISSNESIDFSGFSVCQLLKALLDRNTDPVMEKM